MNQNEIKVMRGFLSLSNEEQQNFLKELDGYYKLDSSLKLDFKRLVESRASVGPKNTICGCCGR